MGLATTDPHSQKEHTEIYKILKFGVRVTGIQPFKYVKITKKILVTRISIHFFVNFDVFKWLLSRLILRLLTPNLVIL